MTLETLDVSMEGSSRLRMMVVGGCCTEHVGVSQYRTPSYSVACVSGDYVNYPCGVMAGVFLVVLVENDYRTLRTSLACFMVVSSDEKGPVINMLSS